MKLRLNLSTAPRENKRPFIAAAALLGTIGVLALLILSHAAYKSWRANRDIRVEIARLESDIRVDQRKQHDLETYFQSLQAQQVLDRSGFLNSLIEQREALEKSKVFSKIQVKAEHRPELVTGQDKIVLDLSVWYETT